MIRRADLARWAVRVTLYIIERFIFSVAASRGTGIASSDIDARAWKGSVWWSSMNWWLSLPFPDRLIEIVDCDVRA